jgi:tetratricopeptide (TPR) repeat protein
VTGRRRISLRIPQIHTTPFFRPPGYPYVLAGIYALTSDPLGVRIVQMLLGLLNVVLAFFAGRALFSESVGHISAAGMALIWVLPYFEGELLAPVLLVTLVLLQILVWQRWCQRCAGGWSILSGVLLGFFALTRPNALLLFPLLLLWSWRVERKRRDPNRGVEGSSAESDPPLESLESLPSAPPSNVRSALLGLSLGLLLTVLPASLRNYLIAGDPVLITANAGVNLYIGNNPEADGYTARIPILGELAGLPAGPASINRASSRLSRVSKDASSAPPRSRASSRPKPSTSCSKSPAARSPSPPRRPRSSGAPQRSPNNREIQIVRDESAVLRYLPGFATLLSLAVLGAIRLGVEQRRLGHKPANPDAHGIRAVHSPDARLRAQRAPAARRRRLLRVAPPLLRRRPLPSAAGPDPDALRRLRHRTPRGRSAHAPLAQRLPLGLGLLAALVLAHVPLVSYSPDVGQYHFQRGDAYRMQGDRASAEREYRLAITRDPEPGPVPHNNLGALLTQQGRLREALEQLQVAVRLAPRYLSAQVNLSVAWLRAPATRRAIEALQAAVRIDPEQAELRERLGALLLQAGRPQDAIPQLAFAAQRTQRPETRYLWAAALADTGARAEAKAILQELLRDTSFGPGPGAAARVTLSEAKNSNRASVSGA